MQKLTLPIGWKLTKDQRKFHQNWNAPILIFDSVETVLMWANAPRGSKSVTLEDHKWAKS